MISEDYKTPIKFVIVFIVLNSMQNESIFDSNLFNDFNVK